MGARPFILSTPAPTNTDPVLPPPLPGPKSPSQEHLPPPSPNDSREGLLAPVLPAVARRGT
jgi:hypothetical protein